MGKINSGARTEVPERKSKYMTTENTIAQAREEKIAEESQLRQFTQSVNVGLFSASFAIFLGMLQVETLDRHLLICLICFAIIFPFNAFFGFVFQLLEIRLLKEVIHKSISTNTFFNQDSTSPNQSNCGIWIIYPLYV